MFSFSFQMTQMTATTSSWSEPWAGDVAVFFRPDPVSPSRASYSSPFLEYVEMPQETSWGR